VCVCLSLYVCVWVRSGPLLYMVEVMILRDFTRFTVLIVCVMLSIAVGLTWRFDSSSSYYNTMVTWWTFMSIFVDAGSSPLICILLEVILLQTAL
jgi:hypothetical protein